RTRRLDLAGPTAARARCVELHATAGLRNLSAAVALRTGLRSADGSFAVAVRAGFQVRDVEAQHCAANGIPKPDVDLVFKVSARLRLMLHTACATSGGAGAEDAGQDIPES